jgi:Ca2+-binding RTX toxin-like protein
MATLPHVDTTQTITTDQTPTTGSAIIYDVGGIAITIANGIAAASRDADAIVSDFSGSTLINKGNVLSAVGNAVLFDGGNSSITNNPGRSIVGLSGIFLDEDGNTVTNHGSVSGLTGDGITLGVASNHTVLNNDGDIYGKVDAFHVASGHEGGVIHNSGTMRSDFACLLLDGLKTVIDNQAGGLIKGPTAIQTGAFGRISLTNHGTVSGGIDCNAANQNDVLVNFSKIIGQVHLGSGNDFFQNVGGGTSGKVFGEDGADTLRGGSGIDNLLGGAAHDTLTGGLNKDILTGGTGRDIFDFNSVFESKPGATHRDVITDFTHGTNVTGDDIDLRTIDAKPGGTDNSFTWIIQQPFHHLRGELRFKDLGAACLVQGDVNGDGAADIEILVRAATLSKTDFLL